MSRSSSEISEREDRNARREARAESRVSLSLEVRCLMKGLFCASSAIVCGFGVWSVGSGLCDWVALRARVARDAIQKFKVIDKDFWIWMVGTC